MKSSRMRHALLSVGVLACLVVPARPGKADAPPGRYSITNGGTPTGTVLDTQTQLTWQQAVPAASYTWANAGSYCTSNMVGLPGVGWRLPTMQELQTIVDDSQKVAPVIDPTAFPGTPGAVFWTSSAYAPQAGNAWNVDFSLGTTFHAPASTTYTVRCVR